MAIDQLSKLHIYDQPLGGIIGRYACEINCATKMDVSKLSVPNIFFLFSYGEVHELLLAKDRNMYYFFSLISFASIVVWDLKINI